MNQTEIFEIPDGTQPQRLDLYLSQKYPDKTRSSLTKLIKSGHIRINDQQIKSGHIVHPHDQIKVTFPNEDSSIEPVDIPINIIYEDEQCDRS